MLAGSPELTGAGARQVVLDGRATKPETMLLGADENADEKMEDELDEELDEELITLADDCAALIDATGLLPEPEPPPPHELKHKKLAISSHFFTLVFMVITSQ